MTPETTGEITIASNDDVVRVRQLVRTAATAAGLSLVDQTKIVTAASELARNTLVHGGGGSARVEPAERTGRRPGVRVTFTDDGPGIPDIDRALTEGWTSGGGLGLGLPGARRLVDEFDLRTEPGAGTTVTVTKWPR
ncbi:Serine/threonine-protein kinase RsbT [Actinomadura rubteroloni]|uniref:Serine/threonine-protein kinase RsbT n=1 Tax=Actinomadura rubteroloni TaxID=1926885 RepID=A0A2P4UD48_9ACTN|nr:anti-sigma regulatory factor [Actinomadura rubteroloni]POM22970.1 Serine/threonine-protein kinase RsbT [Actinomadura rubteroloni]